MIDLQDHCKLKQYYKDYQTGTNSEVDYQDWLEYLLLHRTGLLKLAEEKLAVQETAFAKIENYCNQVYQAALQEKLGLQTSLFVVGAILGAVHKVLGKEVEELK